MADISNISKIVRNRVKGAIRKLDNSTNIDERIGNAWNRSNFNPNRKPLNPTPKQSFYYNPSKYRANPVTKAGAFVQRGLNATADRRIPTPFSPTESSSSFPKALANAGVNILNSSPVREIPRQVRDVGNSLGSLAFDNINYQRPFTADSKAFQFAENAVLPFREQWARDQLKANPLKYGYKTAGNLVGAFSPALFATGLENPALIAGQQALGTGLNYITGGKDRSLGRAFNTSIQGLDKSIPMAGVMGGTNEYVTTVGSKLPIVQKLALRSAANVGQGILIDKASDLNTTAMSIAIDALMPIGGEALSGVFKKSVGDSTTRLLQMPDGSYRWQKASGEFTFKPKYINMLEKAGFNFTRDTKGKIRAIDYKGALLSKRGAVDFGAKVGQPEDLIEEAKKYKSAEEFIKAQSLYHGTPNEIKGGKLTFGAGDQLKKGGYMGGHFLTDTPEIAEGFSFGGKVYQAPGNIKNKVLDVNANKKMFEDFIGKKYKTIDGETVDFTRQDFDYMFPGGKADWSTLNTDLAEQVAKKQGKIGVAIPEYANGKQGMTYQIFEDNIPVYTKSQLTDIYNQAKGASDSVGNFSKQAKNLIKQEVERLKSQVGGVGIIKKGEDFTGGGYRSSLNPQWYRDFFAEYGRKPSEKQYRELAIKNLKTGEVDGLFNTPGVLKYNRDILNKPLDNIDRQINAKPITEREANKPAKRNLSGLLSYQDNLVKGGLPVSEADKISYGQYKKGVKSGKLSNFLQNVPENVDNTVKSSRPRTIQTNFPTPDGPIDINTKTGIRAELNKILKPIKNAPKEVQKEISDWGSRILTGRTKANEVINRFSGIDEKDGWKFIKKFQDPKAKVDLGGKYAKEMSDLRNYYNSIRKEGIRRGLDINYLDNYLNQVWKNPPEEVDKALAEYMKKGKGLGKNPSFTKQRKFKTYEEGVAYGLTPKYTHPGQLAAHYRYQLERALANRDLISHLKRLGAIVPADKAPTGWRTIDTQLVPDMDGFRAEPNIAKSLNNMFTLDKGNAFLRTGAKVSRATMEVSMSGGVPKTPLNAFTIANMIKEFTAGRFKSPTQAFFTAMSDKKTKNFFKERAKYSTMMAEEGIRSRSTVDYNKAYKNLLEAEAPRGAGKKFADWWHTAMEEPTFNRFMPMLEVNTFKDTYDRGIKEGLTHEEARKLAGDTTKAWHGVADKLSRSKDVENALSTIFFAPTFRESMLNFWGKNIKALLPKNLTNPAYKYNRKYLGGVVLTYVLYDLLNKQLTGHYMHQNKGGKEFFLEIPRKNNRSWFIPLQPSIATVPRRGLEIGGALRKGDVRTATQRAGSFFSQPLNVGSSLLTNRTFYGGPIYKKEDTVGGKVGKLAGYTAEELAHPYIGGPIAVAQGRKTPTEALMSTLELPVYPSKSTSTKGVKLGKLFGSNKVDASRGAGASLPTNTKDLASLYGNTNKIINSYREKKTDILYNPKYDQATRDKKLQELQNSMDTAMGFKRQIEKERPDQILDIGVMTYSKDGSQSTEARGEWVIKQLESVGEDDTALSDVVNKLYEGKVLTKGVVKYLNDQGFNITKYNYGTGFRYLGGGSGSGKSSKYPNKLKGVSSNVKIGSIKTSPYYSKGKLSFNSLRKSKPITLGSLTTSTPDVISASELKALANPTIKLTPYK